MGIVYTGLSPHAPILLPSIGMNHYRRVEHTVEGLTALSQELKEADPEVLILITPHGPLHSKRLTLFTGSKAQGTFSSFGYPDLGLSVPLSQEMNKALLKVAEERYLSTIGEEDPSLALDHGALVPLYFLKKAGFNREVTILSMGLMDYQELFTFGELLSSICHELGVRTALLASGDLSHRLTPEAPAGYSPQGKTFDEEVAKALGSEDREALLKLDQDLIRKAGECGFRPLLIMMGSIKDLPFTGTIFSYEGPFGVGYMVAGFKERDDDA